MAASYSVWLLHHALGYPLALLDQYLSLEYVKTVNGIGAFTIQVPTTFNFDLFHEDTRIVVFRKPAGGAKSIDFCGFVRYVEKTRSRKRTRAVAGPDLNELLNTRIVAYAAASAQADMTDQADDMMKEVVRDNLGADAIAARDLSSYGFTVQANVAAGTNISKGFAWRNVLDTLRDISDTSHSTEATCAYFGIVPLSIGWDCEFRTNIVQWGMDHRFPDGAAGPIIFSAEFGNVANVLRSTDYRNEVTYAYAGGQGEESERDIQESSDSTRIGMSPFNRRELFLDARNESASAAVLDVADGAVRNGRPRKLLAATLINVGSYVYGRDYKVGDYVTVSFEGEMVDCRIESVHVTVVEGKEAVDINVKAEA